MCNEAHALGLSPWPGKFRYTVTCRLQAPASYLGLPEIVKQIMVSHTGLEPMALAKQVARNQDARASQPGVGVLEAHRNL